jgi:hypothetical protein
MRPPHVIRCDLAVEADAGLEPDERQDLRLPLVV